MVRYLLDHPYEILGVITALVAIYLAWLAVASPRLSLSPDKESENPTLLGGGSLAEVNMGDTDQTTVLDLNHYGLIVHLTPHWTDRDRDSEPARISFYIKNTGKKTAKSTAIYLRTHLSGFRVSLDGGQPAESEPIGSFFQLAFKSADLQSRELKAIHPGMKKRVSITLYLPSRQQLEIPFRLGKTPLFFLDYYLTAEDTKPVGKAMWITLLPSAELGTDGTPPRISPVEEVLPEKPSK